MIVLSAGSHRVKATSINGDETFSATFNIIGNSQLVSIPFREVSEVALVPEPFGLPVPLERGAHPNVAVTHGHDPPSLGSLSPRAPPA